MAHGAHTTLAARSFRGPSTCRLFCLMLCAAGVCVVPAQEADGYSYARQYVEGETNYYELTVHSIGAESELRGLSEHRTISLHPAGELKLPEVRSSSIMLAMVTDLHTFYFAVSPEAGITKLKAAGDSFATLKPLKGDWSHQPGFLLGQDRTTVRIRLAEITPEHVTYETEFLPPDRPSLPMYRTWMQDPVCGPTPNSFQMVQRRDKGFLAAWGCEESRVTTQVDRAGGKILSASMDNRVKVKSRLCIDEDLQQCDELPEATTTRQLTLTHMPTPEEDSPPNRVKINPRDGQEYIWIPPGRFKMGCVPLDKECYGEEMPRHAVTITQGFWMGRTEAPVWAYEEFAALTGREMPREPGSGELPDYNSDWEKKNYPMVKVTWEEAASFCEWAQGRLPTEAEWEYAARGGEDGSKYPWGDERSHQYANLWRTSGRDQWEHTAPVGSFPPNGFGLYDMAGNVYEWVQDWYDEHYYSRSPSVYPQGPARGRLRVARGGSGFINPAALRISTRLRNRPSVRNVGVGFRCVWEAAE